jgi:hypothetical protein
VATFEFHSFAAHQGLRMKLWNAKHEPSEPINTFINTVTDLVRGLEAIDHTPTEEEVRDLLLSKLDSSLDVVRTILISQMPTPSLSTIKSTLLNVDTTNHIAISSSDTVLIAHTSGHCGGDGGFAWGNPSGDPKACNRCGQSGPVAAVCMADMPQWRKDEIKGSFSQASFAEIGEIDDKLVQEASHLAIVLSNSFPRRL